MNLHVFAGDYRLRKPKLDDCGDLNIIGKRGDIYEFDETRLAATILRAPGAHHWNKYRKAAQGLGLKITQNGDEEGTFLFDPESSVEAEFAIEAIRAPRKKQLSPEHLEKLRQTLYRARAFRRKTQSEPQDDVQHG